MTAITTIASFTAVALVTAIAIGAFSPIGARLLLRANRQWRSEKNEEHA